jgi:hypothetical protein
MRTASAQTCQRNAVACEQAETPRHSSFVGRTTVGPLMTVSDGRDETRYPCPLAAQIQPSSAPHRHGSITRHPRNNLAGQNT